MIKLVIALAASLAASTVHAATLNYSDSFGPAYTDLDHIISLPQFDPSLGTLTGVSVALDSNIYLSSEAENLSHGSVRLSSTETGAVTLSEPDGTVLSTPFSSSDDRTLGAFDGVVDFDGTSGYTAPVQDISGSVSNMVDPALFTAYIGTGAVDELLSASADTFTRVGGGNVIFGYSTQASGTATVTYSYDVVPHTAVPEAASIGLLGLGIGVLGLACRRRAA